MTLFAPGIVPDPMRVHGAWVYLFASVGAGALLGSGRGVEPALLVGTAFAGGYLVAGAFTVGVRRRLRQFTVGMSLAAFAVVAALGLGADRWFLVACGAGALLAFASVLLARRCGVLSPWTLGSGLASLTLAAPAATLAGGVSPARSGLVFLLLWAFFLWRSWRQARRVESAASIQREELRQSGLREAGYAAVWALAVALTLTR